MRRKGTGAISAEAGRFGRCALTLLTGIALGCGDGELEGPGACEDPVFGSGPTSTALTRVGFVVAQDTWDRTIDDTGVSKDVRSGRVQAGFADLSTVTSTPARLMPLSTVCVGLISRPVRTGRATPLPVSEVRVEGTARGTILASQAGPGTYVAVGDPILGEGTDPLRFVVSSTQADGFVAGDEALDGLRGTVQLSAPDPNAPPGLTTDPYPVRWVSAGADWVEITVSPQGDGVDDGGQVVCQVADTGCFDLPVAANAFLLSGNADHYTLSVQLHRYRAVDLDARHFLEVEAVAETRLTLDNGVFE